MIESEAESQAQKSVRDIGAAPAGEQQAMEMSTREGSTDDGVAPSTSAVPTEPARPRSPDTLERLVAEKDALAARLAKQLLHYRAWVASVHLRVQHMNSKAIQNAKRLYVGSLPQNASEEELCDFLNQLMQQTGAQIGPEPAVIQCHINPERNFAFAEFRSVEEASNAMGLDGVAWKDTFLKVRRPSNYDLATSLMLGPITPDPTMDVSCLHLSKPLPEESPNKLFVGGLPCEWPEQAVRLLLEPWGAMKAFNLVMDKATGNSKGYAFCEFVDESVTDSAIAGLNGQRAGTKTLTVKRAAEGARLNVNSSAGAQASSTGISPIPTPSQPSSFDDPGPGAQPRSGGTSAQVPPGGAAAFVAPGGYGGGPGSGFFNNRKGVGSSQAVAAAASQGGSGSYMMSPQPIGMLMSPPGPARGMGTTPAYGAMAIPPRPMATSMDSHMQHMQSMQQHAMMQPYMGQPMHLSPGGFGAMVMAPGPVMMQSPTSYQGSMEQFIPMASTPSNRGGGHSKPTRQHSGLANPPGGSGNWSSQVMQTGPSGYRGGGGAVHDSRTHD